MHAPTQNPLLTGPILPTLTRLAWPNMIAMVATSLVAIAETSYVGILGTPALAGLALVFPIVMLQQMMSGGAMGGGVSSSIARALGANEEARARSLAVHAAIIGLSAGLVLALIVFVFARPMFAALGGRGPSLDEAVAYARVYSLAIVGVWLTNTLASVVRGSGNMKVPSTTVFIAAAMQIVVGGALGLGLGPFPRLGMAGVAFGQVACYSGAAAFLLWFLWTGRARVKFGLAGVAMQGELFRDILRVGGVACISPIQSVATVLIVTRLVAHFGTEALAGYGIGARLEFLLIPISFAIGVACVPMVGMAIGAGMVSRARRVAWTGGLLSAVMLGAVGLFFAAFPALWSRMFTSDPAVLESARVYLVWSGLSYSFFGVGLCLYFASQGAGKVLGPVLAGTVRLAVVIAGGLWLTSWDSPQWMMFVVVALSMAAYGLATAGFIWITPWGKK